MIGRRRLGLTFATCLFALASLFSGLDRLSELDAQAGRFVPSFLRADSWRVSAKQALAEGDLDRAADYARQAVATDPFDARALGLLGLVQLNRADMIAASQTFAAGDRLGYRSPIIQAFFFDTALAAGDAKQAAIRLDTLLLTNPQLQRQSYFFTALEASEEGRRELAARVLTQPQWAVAYLSAFGEDDQTLRSRAAFIAQNANQLPLGCEPIEPMLRELARRSYRADAARLAAAQCPSRAVAEGLADPGFSTVGDDTAFGWRRHASGDVRISAVGDSNRAVEFANRSATTQLVLSQPVALEPAEYRAFASVLAGSPDAALASLDCGRPQRPSSRGGALGRGQLLTAPPCEDLVLGIWVKPGMGTVRIDDLRLTSVGKPPF